MSHQIDFEKVASIAFQYALVKDAGIYSEIAGTALNPFNTFLAAYPAAAVALSNRTRTKEDQAKADQSMLSNLLIPGVGPYNLFKRLGHSIRNPDLVATKKDLARGRNDRKSPDEQEEQYGKTASIALNYTLMKCAGVVSELIGNTLNPFNQFGGQVGGGIAALSNNTRTHADQAKADESILANLFVPGVAPYNTFKRIGYSLRNTDLRKAKRDLARRRWEEQDDDNEAGKEENAQTKAANVALRYTLAKAAAPNPTAGAASAGAPGFNWQHALMGAGLGAGAGALSGLIAPGRDKDDEEDTAGSAMYRGLLGGGLGALAGGLGGQYLAPYLSGKSAPQSGSSSYIPGSSTSVQNALGREPLGIDRSIGAAADRLAQSSGQPRPQPQQKVSPPGTAPGELPTRPDISFPEPNYPAGYQPVTQQPNNSAPYPSAPPAGYQPSDRPPTVAPSTPSSSLGVTYNPIPPSASQSGSPRVSYMPIPITPDVPRGYIPPGSESEPRSPLTVAMQDSPFRPQLSVDYATARENLPPRPFGVNYDNAAQNMPYRQQPGVTYENSIQNMPYRQQPGVSTDQATRDLLKRYAQPNR